MCVCVGGGGVGCGGFSASPGCSSFLKCSQYCCETQIIQIQQRKIKMFSRTKIPKTKKSLYYLNCIDQSNFFWRKLNFRVNI